MIIIILLIIIMNRIITIISIILVLLLIYYINSNTFAEHLVDLNKPEKGKIIKFDFNRPNSNVKLTKKYKLTIMAIFKNEEKYMEEWLLHHINQGFDQIFLYCNDPNINKYPCLFDEKYSNYITLIDWTNKINNGVNTIQRQAYTHCTKTYSKYCHFLMMIDLDEFIHSYKDFKTVNDYIDSLYNNWSNIKSFKIQRYDFGSNGHISKPDGLLIDNYTKHEKTCSSYKALANLDFVNEDAPFYGVHDFPYNEKLGIIYNEYLNYWEAGYPNTCRENDINETPLIINHYYTKSYDEYIERCEMWKDGGINPWGYRKNCDKLFKSRDVNEIVGF